MLREFISLQSCAYTQPFNHPRAAQDEEIELVHTAAHHSYVGTLAGMKGPQLKEESRKWDSVYFNKHSTMAARMAAGSCESPPHTQCHTLSIITLPRICNNNGGYCISHISSSCFMLCLVGVVHAFVAKEPFTSWCFLMLWSSCYEVVGLADAKIVPCGFDY